MSEKSKVLASFNSHTGPHRYKRDFSVRFYDIDARKRVYKILQLVYNMNTDNENNVQCYKKFEEDEYKQRMIQLQQRMLNRQSSKVEQYDDNVFDTRRSGPQMMSNIQTPKKGAQPSFESPTNIIRNNEPQTRQSNTSVDSYFTIHSGSASNYSLSKRSFKSVQRKKSISIPNMNQSKATQQREFKDLYIDNTSETDMKLSRVQSSYNTLSEAMFEWNQIQYERSSRNSNIQINSTEELKLSSNIFINEAVNKMEDYYTFYFCQINKQFVKSGKKQEQLLTPYSGHLFRKYPQFKCSYHCEHQNLTSTQTYMTLMTFQSNTSNAIQFLKWYNSSTIQSKLFNIQKQKLLQNGTYPIFQLQQYNSEIKQKYKYITVRQIQTVKFDNQPDTQYILQLDTTFRKGNYFKCLIRFSDSDNGLVEIYGEWTEKLKGSAEGYFLRKWKILEALIQERLVKISVSRVVK